MVNSLEIERKYLVKFPKSWEQLSELFDGLLDIHRITQTYLIPKGDDPSARVRKTVRGLTDETHTEYHYNQKKPVETGTHQELERTISEKQYQQYLQEPYPGKGPVEKTRFVFKYQDQVFELDVFKGKLKGLAILEIELDDKNEAVNLPPFLEVIREITKDRSYTNFSLADRTK